MKTATALAAVLLAVCTAASAQTRVIEETLVVRDPTVASRSSSIFGAAIEGLYVNTPFRSFSSSNDGTYEDGKAKGGSFGANLFAGYGDFTLAYTHRNGSGKSTLTHNPSATVPERYTHSVEMVPKQDELLLRWLGRGLSTTWFTPYLYAGYTQLKSDFDDIRDTGVWPESGTNRLKSLVKSKSSMGGIGGIVPVTATYGFRGDIGFLRTKQTTERQGLPTKTGTGTGSRVTGTMYYNFGEGWNAQLGGRYEYFNGGAGGHMTLAGVFAMLGYTFK
jgi:hypothetical protein